jgi:hypothetical protein
MTGFELGREGEGKRKRKKANISDEIRHGT